MAGRALRIVFFGTPEFAVPTLEALLDSHHAVVGVVTQPDRPRGRGQRVSDSPVKRLALASGVPVLQPDRLKDEAFLASLRALERDLGVVAGLRQDPAGRRARGAAARAHQRARVAAAPLPRRRAGAPRRHRRRCRNRRHHHARGPGARRRRRCFATVVRPIGPDDTSADVERDLAALGAALLARGASTQLAAGTRRRSRRRTTAPRPTRTASERKRASSTGGPRPPRSTTRCAACSRGRWPGPPSAGAGSSSSGRGRCRMRQTAAGRRAHSCTS